MSSIFYSSVHSSRNASKWPYPKLSRAPYNADIASALKASFTLDAGGLTDSSESSSCSLLFIIVMIPANLRGVSARSYFLAS